MNLALSNLFYGLGGQLLILFLGLIIPRFILVYFGSEMNGLLSTVTQIFVYMALLESGIGNAAVNLLYKPLIDKEKLSVISVLYTTEKYYRKITKIYFFFVILLTVVYPFVAKTDIDKTTVALVVFFQGVSGVVTFYFAAAYKSLLIADGKNYVISNINLLFYILISIIKIIFLMNGGSIVIIQIMFFILTCMQTYMFLNYIRKEYSWIVFNPQSKTDILEQKNAFLIHEISSVVFSNTDIFLLSIFCSMKIASVYAIYNMVFVSLNAITVSINNGFGYIFGQTYHLDKNKYIKLHDAYDSYYMAFVFAIISTAYLLITPFIRLYTFGISDIDYVDPYLPLLFCLISLLSCSRAVSAKLIIIAGHAKKTQMRSIIEMCINLLISLFLVSIIGIYGVLLGTLTALLYRMNDIIIYANRKILFRSPARTYLSFIINLLIFSIIVFYQPMINFDVKSYYDFLLAGICTSVIMLLIYFSCASIANISAFNLVIKKLFR